MRSPRNEFLIVWRKENLQKAMRQKPCLPYAWLYDKMIVVILIKGNGVANFVL